MTGGIDRYGRRAHFSIAVTKHGERYGIACDASTLVPKGSEFDSDTLESRATWESRTSSRWLLEPRYDLVAELLYQRSNRDACAHYGYYLLRQADRCSLLYLACSEGDVTEQTTVLSGNNASFGVTQLQDRFMLLTVGHTHGLVCGGTILVPPVHDKFVYVSDWDYTSTVFCVGALGNSYQLFIRANGGFKKRFLLSRSWTRIQGAILKLKRMDGATLLRIESALTEGQHSVIRSFR